MLISISWLPDWLFDPTKSLGGAEELSGPEAPITEEPELIFPQESERLVTF